jgi:hypothetical protein
MTMLDSLLGGGQKQELDDFVNRYDQGAPWEGISDQEAIGRYQQVASRCRPTSSSSLRRTPSRV